MIYQSIKTRKRKGLTLIEVLVATAIFLISLVAIGQLINASSDQAIDVQLRSRAARLAQSKMSEYTSGIRSLDGGGTSGDFEEDFEPGWNYTVAVEADSTAASLYKVTVTVNYGEVSTSLTQYVFDAKKRGTIQAASQSSSSSSSTTGSSTSSSSSSSSTSSTTTTQTTNTNSNSNSNNSNSNSNSNRSNRGGGQ